MDGSATLTTEPSTKTTAVPRMQAISVRRLVRASATRLTLRHAHDRVRVLVEAVAFGVARAAGEPQEALAEARRLCQRERDLGEDGVLVGRVDPERLERVDGVGVDRLRDEQAARPQLRPGEL